MLKIERTAPDAFTAASGDALLGWCRFAAQRDATIITEAFLSDEKDTALLDGLLRAAFFYGLDEGRPLAGVDGALRTRWGVQLKALGLTLEENTPVLDLPRKCQVLQP